MVPCVKDGRICLKLGAEVEVRFSPLSLIGEAREENRVKFLHFFDCPFIRLCDMSSSSDKLALDSLGGPFKRNRRRLTWQRLCL